MAALFQPFRALGYITEDVPFAVQRRGKDTFVTVSVGRAWQIYNTTKLTLSLVGPEHPDRILALAAQGELTFAAVGADIVECKRVHRSGEYKGHDKAVKQLLVLGEYLLSLGSDQRLLVWRIGEHTAPENVVDLPSGFEATCMAHPDTYLNKIVVGGTQGRALLYNFVTGKLLYTFDLGPSAICCIVPSPALDVIAFGMADGRAVLHNLKFDEQVASFANASGVGAKNSLLLSSRKPVNPGEGPCTAISFRTGSGVPLMAAGGSAGVITVWNLEARRLQTIIRDAHDSPLLSLHFFAGEPRLMSSAGDNSLKQWVFDNTDGPGRLLRFRSGHAAPPTILRHYGDGNRLLSAGEDRAFRMFSTIQDQQSRELSQGHIAKKAKKLKVEQAELRLAPVVAMDACQVRERDWANVITAHSDDSSVYTWRLQNFSLGEHVLTPPTKRQRLGGDVTALATPATAVAMSSCGNFGFVGSQCGRLDRYNMQSGRHRGSYSRALDGKQSNAHTGAVTGISVDACNHVVVSCGHDGFLRVWDFKTCKLKCEIAAGARLLKLAMHPGTLLAAVADEYNVLRMYDVETERQVRVFKGHTDGITDVSISTDGRWLMSSSLDGSLRVWDIPAARVLQVIKLGSAVTSFSLAPAQELLATTHLGKKGIYLWANHLIYGGAGDIVHSDRPIDASLPAIHRDPEPSALQSGQDEGLDSAGRDDLSINGVSQGPYTQVQGSGAPQPLSAQMITLSMLPRTQWQNLAHLEAIRERSKPVQPPKKPEAAPFFLPTVASVARDPVFDTAAQPDGENALNGKLPGWGDDDDNDDGSAEAEEVVTGSKKRKQDFRTDPSKKSRVVQQASAHEEVPEFLAALRRGGKEGNFSEFVALLRQMSPVAVDQQLQSMQVVDLEQAEETAVQDLALVLQMAESEIEAGRSFEHIQALLRAYLNVHGDTLLEHAELNQKLGSLQEKLGTSWERLRGKLQHCRCLVNFLGNLPS